MFASGQALLNAPKEQPITPFNMPAVETGKPKAMKKAKKPAVVEEEAPEVAPPLSPVPAGIMAPKALESPVGTTLVNQENAPVNGSAAVKKGKKKDGKRGRKGPLSPTTSDLLAEGLAATGKKKTKGKH